MPFELPPNRNGFRSPCIYGFPNKNKEDGVVGIDAGKITEYLLDVLAEVFGVEDMRCSTCFIGAMEIEKEAQEIAKICCKRMYIMVS